MTPGNNQRTKLVLYVAIAALTAFCTDQTVLACLNEPAVIGQMHWFQWAVLAIRCVLSGLIVWKAVLHDPAAVEAETPSSPGGEHA
jgi:uncharacterized membrane protein (DUF485 family)